MIQSVAPSGACEHATGIDGEDLGITVQLFPYADTPNPGGVYKAWVTPTSRLDCGRWAKFGCFVPRYSKTDNFKVIADAIVEIDTRFWKNGEALLGLAAGWTDTVGASNVKYSEYNPAILAFREAHVEAAEGGHPHRRRRQPGRLHDRPRGGTARRDLQERQREVPRLRDRSHPGNAGDDTTYRVEVYCK